jgi:MFS family permease
LEHRHVGSILGGLREGFDYAFGFAPVRALLLLLALISFTSASYTTLLPIFAARHFHGGAGTLGLLSAGAGVGALAAAIMLAARTSVLGLGRWIAFCPALFGVALIAFSFANQWIPAAALLGAAGFAQMGQMAATNTVLQTIVPEEKRGRVMSYYTMAFLGMAPIGSLLGGAIADRIGAGLMVRLAGACAIGGSLLMVRQLKRLRELVRPLYIELGILPAPISPASPDASVGS